MYISTEIKGKLCMRHPLNVGQVGVRIDCAKICPNIIPNGTEPASKADVEITIMPKASAGSSVTAVGAAATSGLAMVLIVAPFNSGMYVLVPRSVVTILPTDLGKERITLSCVQHHSPLALFFPP